MNKSFIQVPNSIFFYNQDTHGTEIHKIGTKGFTVWSYMNMLQGGNNILPITINSLSKQLNVKGLKDKRVIKAILLNLKRLNYINCDSLTKETKPNELIYIEVWKYTGKGYSQIDSQLIHDQISTLGHIAFTLYCLMHKEHSADLGNQSLSDNGYCQRKTEWFAERLNLTRSTVETHINKIPSILVKVEEQKPMVEYNDKGDKIFTQQPNRYFVKAKYNSDNKYYI